VKARDTARRELYPRSSPFDMATCAVSDVHEIYYEEAATRRAKPAVFLPRWSGAGSITARQFFDPQHYRIVVSISAAADGAAQARAWSRTRPGIWSPT